jgi:hypothetical protein
MYDELLNYIRKYDLNPNTTDFVITRTHINDKYSQDIVDGTGMIKLGRGGDLLKLLVEGELTEEEKAYTKYDLDKLFGVSSYTKIKKQL